MNQLRSVDLSAYGRSFVLLVRFPQVMVGPLLAGVVQFTILTSMTLAGSGDPLSSILFRFIGILLNALGLGLALIVADDAWRRNRAPFSEAWEDASRKIGSIFFAALGVNFVTYVATLVGGMFGGFAGIALGLIASYFLVYAIPAAAIGGVPGGAPALETSISRARANPIPTLLVTILSFVASGVAVSIAIAAVQSLLSATFMNDRIFSGIATAIVTSVFSGYLALVLAKVYTDISYGRRW